MKKVGRTIYIIIAAIIVVVAKLFLGDGESDTYIPDDEILENYLPTSRTGEVIEHEAFTLSYSEHHKQPEWVAYELTREMAQAFNEERVDFRSDPMIEEDAVTPSDYTRSGYDRGHLVPAADMAFSEKAMAECFYMSNISPQEPRFNRGIWKKLEEQVREWAIDYEHLYIVTGPVLSRKAKARFPEDKGYIAVPHSFYKVLLDYHGDDIKAIAFWMENEESDAPLRSFAISVDDLEKITGLDFFPGLPDDIEELLESNVSTVEWGLHKMD